MGRRKWVGAGLGAGLVAAVGVGLVVAPAGAAAAPVLPPISPEDLVSSVMTAQRGPLAGEVEVDNALGLPAVPGAPQLANGTSTIRVWSGGEGRGRVAIPSPDGERTLVSDGTTRWAYDSQDRTATRSPAGDHQGPPEGAPGQDQDPTTAATQAIATLRQTSTVAVDGTAEVAGRAAYQLVLTPQPTERTLLREVRVAVDAETRLPLQLTVLAQGSAEPALQVGFSEITYGPQDPSLFTFTPPPGTTVRDGQDGGRPDGQQGRPEGERRTVGDGWDTVIVGRAPAREGGEQQQRPEGAPDLSALGTPVSGPWGSGRAITTAVATVIVTDDGRIAAGAVPQQVLTEALAQ
ncbi:outer membrane lipoprotein-sorting protein [Actinomycetospora succinea]|uniref:Outer membrane lipoprotein-sorting protein n=1 Tax=Actinomycetospora succinea TaxID=663603 RepID=A0A4R6VM01_9PSEU|nr:outer membrane lipoprotein carrier protein LolA [Actinomycetospora succinea]TDQ62995.1 outer membrane lipoprotein-sorting protein [Actinomycetospora succinea]